MITWADNGQRVKSRRSNVPMMNRQWWTHFISIPTSKNWLSSSNQAVRLSSCVSCIWYWHRLRRPSLLRLIQPMDKSTVNHREGWQAVAFQREHTRATLHENQIWNIICLKLDNEDNKISMDPGANTLNSRYAVNLVHYNSMYMYSIVYTGTAVPLLYNPLF